MTLTTFLVTWTLVLAGAIVLALAVYLTAIAYFLYRAGGSNRSYLAKIRFGLRAIETETGQIRPQATALTEGLRALDAGLRSVERDLAAALANLKGGAE